MSRKPTETDWLQHLPFPAWRKDLRLRYVEANPAWCVLLGVDHEDEVLGRTDADLLPQWHTDALLKADLIALRQHRNVESLLRLSDEHGQHHSLRCFRRATFDDTGQLTGLTGILQDVSEADRLSQQLKAAEAQQSNWLRALEHHALIATMDRQQRISYVSTSLARLIGQPPQALVGRKRSELPWHSELVDLNQMLALAEQGNPSTFEFNGTSPDGRRYWLRSLVIALHSPSAVEQVFLELITDLSQEKAAHSALTSANDQLLRVLQENTDLIARLEVSARTDALTGLLNRRAFLERAQQEEARSRRTGNPLALVMLDIDHFKRVNDEFGHDGGDKALVALARLLTHELRTHDVVGRLGGEEFAMMLPDTDAIAAASIAERVRAAIAARETTLPDGRVLHFTVSQGLAVRHPDENTGDTLKRADDALYQAKRAGRNRVISVL
ncbi:diguanylate cyclase [Chitinibacteraceae bacterium HSL-7]